MNNERRQADGDEHDNMRRGNGMTSQCEHQSVAYMPLSHRGAIISVVVGIDK